MRPIALVFWFAACSTPKDGGDTSAATSTTGPTTASTTSTTTGGTSTGSGTTTPPGDTATTTTTGGSGFTCSGNPVSFAADVEPTFIGCGGADGCHQLTLGKPGGAIPWLVDVPTDECADHRIRVAPGDPENSYIIDKLVDRGVCYGSPMPKPFGAYPWNPIPDAKIQAIYDWICEGAPDN